MRRNCFILGMLILFLSMGQTNAGAFVFIDEIFADPATGLAGDANADGVRSSTDDEFVELFNPSLSAVDISGWYLADATAAKRHVFASGAMINAQSAFVIFGGGSPQLPGVSWNLASSGTLSLNNTAETITLFDVNNQVIDQVTYGPEADSDQSIVRNPETSTGAWVKHTTLANANGRAFSAGYLINPPPPADLPPLPELSGNSSVVPEPATLSCLGMGLGSLLFSRRRSLKKTA